jgi:glutathione synthase/RimK-type ligase-like ATP-grasp enzyme
MTFFISVNPVGSKFAKALQSTLRDKVVDKVLRTSARYMQRRVKDKIFRVTPVVLNKVQQFERFKEAGVSTPKYALSDREARNIDCKTLFARALINSTGGRGITEFERAAEQYPRAPLYTEYIPKKAEYRVHVFNGEVIDVQQKKKRRAFDTDTRDTRVRNLANGYVYTREGIVAPVGMDTLAVNAVNAVGYSYGAVDIIYNEKRNQCFVLEVNSRPGLMGTTLEKYTEALIKHFNLIRK